MFILSYKLSGSIIGEKVVAISDETSKLTKRLKTFREREDEEDIWEREREREREREMVRYMHTIWGWGNLGAMKQDPKEFFWDTS